jgi:hypothetical protein
MTRQEMMMMMMPKCTNSRQSTHKNHQLTTLIRILDQWQVQCSFLRKQVDLHHFEQSRDEAILVRVMLFAVETHQLNGQVQSVDGVFDTSLNS